MIKVRVLFAGLLGLAAVACSPAPDASTPEAGKPPVTAPASSAPAPAHTSSASGPSAEDQIENAAVAKVIEAVQRHRLTALAAECLDFIVGDHTADGIDVDVHEKHDTHCGGDPDLSPRLFSFHVTRDGKLTTDARDPGAGLMRPLD